MVGKWGVGEASQISPEWDNIQCVVKGTNTLRVKEQLHKSWNLNIQGGGGAYVCHHLCQRKKKKTCNRTVTLLIHRLDIR